jgi:peptide deformylase
VGWSTSLTLEENTPMAVRRIVTYPEPVLRTKAPDLADIDGTIAQLMDDMAETMYVSHGIGLAAPQVGESVRVIAVDIDPGGPTSDLMLLANPVIVEGHGQTVFEEGCLSFPGITVDVPRFTEVFVRALDRSGKPREIEATGLLAICLQHEIDHLDGITFIDRLNPLKRRLVLRRFNRYLANFRKEAGEAA